MISGERFLVRVTPKFQTVTLIKHWILPDQFSHFVNSFFSESICNDRHYFNSIYSMIFCFLLNPEEVLEVTTRLTAQDPACKVDSKIDCFVTGSLSKYEGLVQDIIIVKNSTSK